MTCQAEPRLSAAQASSSPAQASSSPNRPALTPGELMFYNKVITQPASSSHVFFVQVWSARRPRVEHIGELAGLEKSLSLKVFGVHFSCTAYCNITPSMELIASCRARRTIMDGGRISVTRGASTQRSPAALAARLSMLRVAGAPTTAPLSAGTSTGTTSRSSISFCSCVS